MFLETDCETNFGTGYESGFETALWFSLDICLQQGHHHIWSVVAVCKLHAVQMCYIAVMK